MATPWRIGAVKTMGRAALAALVIGIVVPAFVLTLGCQDKTDTVKSGSSDGDGATGNLGKVVLKDGDDGKEIELKAGQALEITLESNPTTGFGWEALAIDPAVVEQQGEKVYKQRETDGRRVGVGGWDTFTFKAATAGTADLKLVYRRSWEKDVAPVKTFTVKVTVEE